MKSHEYIFTFSIGILIGFILLFVFRISFTVSVISGIISGILTAFIYWALVGDPRTHEIEFKEERHDYKHYPIYDAGHKY